MEDVVKTQGIPMEWLNDERVKALVDFRHSLHRCPELSECEFETAQQVLRWLEGCSPDDLLHPLGPTGIAAVYEGKASGKTVVFRCELDALAIPETLDLRHGSRNPGVSHKCGHDGHMSVLAGMAWLSSECRPERGRVVLLFQPAEETGTGARSVIADERFAALSPDYVFGFHNVPGYPLHQILWRHHTFAAASVGARLTLNGVTSHSSYPEYGKSPARAMAEMLIRSLALPEQEGRFDDQVRVTPVNAELGDTGASKNFGIAPGRAGIDITLRANLQNDLERLKSDVEQMARELAARHSLEFGLSWHEEFPATGNHDDAVGMIVTAARSEGLSCGEVEEPFRWSEDFCYYTRRYPGAFFGIGSGVNQPQLHHQHYDFPDALIRTGIRIYARLVHDILGSSVSA